MPNVSHENHLIFMRMTVQVTYIFIPIVSLKDSFCHSGKSKLGIGLFIHELLREPLIYGKTFDSQAPVKSKALQSLRVRSGFTVETFERLIQDKHYSQDKFDTIRYGLFVSP